RAIVRTREAQPQEYVKDLSVRVVPPAPEIKPVAVLGQVRNPAMDFKGAIAKGREDQDVNVRLTVTNKGREIVSREVKLKKGQELNLDFIEKLNLEPGENRIEWSAINKDPQAGDEALETDRRVWVVTYVPKEIEVKPPRIKLTQIEVGPE